MRDPLTNGLVYVYEGRIENKYTVQTESWHNVAFQVCGLEAELLSAYMTGDVAFHNPYGYIPAELYGIFPFEVLKHIKLSADQFVGRKNFGICCFDGLLYLFIPNI